MALRRMINSIAGDHATNTLMATPQTSHRVVAYLRPSDVSFGRQCMNVRVKGGWIKKAALSYPIITILEAYPSTRTDSSQALFATSSGPPTSANFLHRSVKETGSKDSKVLDELCSKKVIGLTEGKRSGVSLQPLAKRALSLELRPGG